MVEYGFSIMGFLRSCAIGYHWKAFKKMVKLLDQIADWKIHFAFFNLQPCNIVLQIKFLNLQTIEILYLLPDINI